MNDLPVAKINKVDAGLAIPVEPAPTGLRFGIVSSLEVEAGDYRLDAAYYFAREPDEDWEFPTSAEDPAPAREPLAKQPQPPPRRITLTTGPEPQEQRRGS